MKKAIVLLTMVSLLSLLIVFASAESSETVAPVIDISTMSAEDLHALRFQIDQRLVELGEYYVDIGKNESGPAVIALQERLIALGYLDGTASGKWDGASQKAMKAYEKVIDVKVDGYPSADEQKGLFSDTAIAKPTPEPTPTPKPTATPDPRKAYGKYDYKAIARNPEEYIGEKVKVSGKAIQVIGSRSEGFTIRLATKGRYDNVVMLYIDSDNAPASNILEDDKLIIYGIVGDNYTYESTLGASITVPLVYAEMVEFQ